MEFLKAMERQMGETLRNELLDNLDIDFDKKLINITSNEELKFYMKVNGRLQCNSNNEFELTSWLSWNLFNGEDWFLYITINEFTKRERYNQLGWLVQYVDNDGDWYDMYEENEALRTNMELND